jgi:Zn-dependent metalloprotease/PKD repeat protein
MKRILGVISFFIVSHFTLGQNSFLTSYSEETIIDEKQQVIFIKLREEFRVNESDVEKLINSLIFSNGIYRVSIINTEKDAIGFTHLRFSVFQNDVKVANKMIIAHCLKGKLISINGDLRVFDPPIGDFSLTEHDALILALHKVNAKKYKWENKADEEQMRNALGQDGFTYYPHGSKVIYEKNGKARSAWMFNIYADEPLYRANVFVDASSGEILDEQNLICDADVPGTAATKYSGTQTITCDMNGTQFQLTETSRGLGIETYNLNNGGTYSVSTDFTSTTQDFVFSAYDQGALDAHWGSEKTYDYFLSEHNRNSIDNAGCKLLSYVHYYHKFQNAFWDGQRMTYGDGNGTTSNIFTSLDVCGHEITHGLTAHTSNLVYNYESGALNESYSDIFGFCVENYARPDNYNWKVGEEVTTNGNGFRNMSDPNALGDPDTYGGVYWYPGAIDNGGVHTNSGVNNFWFYLLCMGGSGTNDFYNKYNVTGLGIATAAKIAFRALTVYFTPYTNFSMARHLSIQAAKDLFGSCSMEMIQTMNAWHAVGVGPAYVAGTISPEFKSDFTTFCSIPASINFSITNPDAVSYTWDFGDGSPPATNINPVHTYTAAGKYNVELKAFGCDNATGSIIKNSFVQLMAPSLPFVVSNATVCENSPAVLVVAGNGVIEWYNNPDSTLIIATGNIFTTTPVSSVASYYVSNSFTQAPVTGGMRSKISAGAHPENDGWLIFDVINTCTLSAVVASASTIGTRTIELRNSENVLLNSAVANFSATGAATLNLNFPLHPGSGYALKLSENSKGNLYRSNWNVKYPYNIGNSISIVSSNKGPGFYYWFYDWQVLPDNCRGPLVPVLVAAQSCKEEKELPAHADSINVFPNPARESVVVNISPLPEGGTISIADVSGRLVHHSVITSLQMIIDVSNFSPGLYFLSVINPMDKTIKTFKLLKD